MNHDMNERDLALLHALQIAPRISWTDAARVLGSTATTLASRWERLRSSGTAWVTVHPIQQMRTVTAAFVELDLAPPQKSEVIDILCYDRRVVTIEEAAGDRTLMLTVMAPDHDSLSRFVLDELPETAGVRRVSMQLATAMHWEGSRWRLDALDRDQRAAIQAIARDRGAAQLSAITEDYWPLVEALAHDGRRGAAELARVTGRNPATVRRQVPRLLSSGLLSFRCEVARLRARWPIVCTWFAHIPVSQLDRTVQALTTLPELRLCVSTTGKTNLMMVLWARSTGELLSLERLLGEKLPWMTLSDSVLLLRSPKRMGWLLHPDGRSTGEVVAPVPCT